MRSSWQICAAIWTVLSILYWAGYFVPKYARWFRWWMPVAISWVFIALFRTFAFDLVQIPTQSMEPTLPAGSHVVISRSAYGPRLPFQGNRMWSTLPERGDIILFTLPQKNVQDFIKRVVGLPGDRINIIGHTITVNEQSLSLTPGKQRVETGSHAHWYVAENEPRTIGFTGIVPPNHVFVIGDNFDKSDDSRMLGTIPMEAVLGKAFVDE